MPSSQSSPSASRGATDAIVATAPMRSGSSAAHASACGPPPDQPIVMQRCDVERVEDGDDVGRAVGHGSARVAVGVAVARP